MDIFSTGALTVVSGIITWGAAMWTYRDKRRDRKEEQADRLKTHSEDLLFKLLTVAREEVAAARVEVGECRDEVKSLRPLERDFYHVQQALDHLDALLYGPEESRPTAERNAKAFVNRMRRLHEARGTMANEVQRAESAVNLAERKIDEAEKPK